MILEKEPIYFKNNLTEWLPNKGNWSICWRATRDGWASSKFHSNCDGIKPTLTIVQVVKKSKTYVFGGYTTESWNSSSKFDLSIIMHLFYNSELVLIIHLIIIKSYNTRQYHFVHFNCYER